jgi:hypothetical protein
VQPVLSSAHMPRVTRKENVKVGNDGKEPTQRNANFWGQQRIASNDCVSAASTRYAVLKCADACGTVQSLHTVARTCNSTEGNH